MDAPAAILPSSNGNGKPVDLNRMAQVMTAPPIATGYKPTTPMEFMWGPDGLPLMTLRRDIEYMRTHPICMNALDYYKSGIAGAEFDVKAEDSQTGDFVLEQVQKFWDIGVPALQQGAYDYGWSGAETKFKEDDAVMKWDGLKSFAPRDTFVLTQGNIPVGIRVNNVQDKGAVDLWLKSNEVPAKGLWYPHNPRFDQFYGQTQYTGAWRPWRRLAWKDGMEAIIDMAYYRFGIRGPVVGYPDESYQTTPPAGAGTTMDSTGAPIKWARDLASLMAEQAKAGASFGLPTTQYPPEMGGGDKWKLDWPQFTLDGSPLIEGAKYLHDGIFYGIGVPPELVQAAETGSGYSGRRIPLEAFLDGQQRIGDALLMLFVEQVVRPLVLWNFGPKKFEVKLKRLLETKNKASAAQPGQQQPGQPAEGQPTQGQGGANPSMQEPSVSDHRRNPHPQNTGSAITFSTHQLFISDRMRQIAREVLKRAA